MGGSEIKNRVGSEVVVMNKRVVISGVWLGKRKRGSRDAQGIGSEKREKDK